MGGLHRHTPHAARRALRFAAVGGIASACVAGLADAAAGPGGIVQGVLDFPNGHYAPGIPDIQVYVRNVATQVESVRVTTDSKGAFVLPNQPAGLYRLCWEAPPGLESGCDSYDREVIDGVSLRYVAGEIQPDPAAMALQGFVSAPGETPYDPVERAACQHNDPFFGVDETARVDLVDGGNLVASRRASTEGQYLLPLPGVPPGSYTIRASCGQNVVEQSVVLTGPGITSQDLTLPPNHRPEIAAVTAERGGEPVAGVRRGGKVTVTVVATDPDSDLLHYRWSATAGKVVSLDAPTVEWKLPKRGKGLHFLYVLVDDLRGGYRSARVAISTDRGLVAVPPPGAPPAALPSDLVPEADRFLAYRGLDTRKSACEYYKAIRAVSDCDADGHFVGRTLSFAKWKKRNQLGKRGKRAAGELKASFRNVADLNLVRDHHARHVGPEHVAYYVCNHAKAEGAIPDVNLVACVAMEYSAIPGLNDDRPFVQFYTFGPDGSLYPSVNLDGRGEKFTPGNCVPCHGGDGYFHHFPELGAGPYDANIGPYFVPFDLDNFEFADLDGLRRDDQEDAIRELNLLLRETAPTPVIVHLLDGWYPGGAGKQLTEFVPPGWDPNVDTRIPAVARGASFDADQLYLKSVRPSCRLCHVAMGTKLGLDFNRYMALDSDDPVTPPDDRVGDFVSGHATLFGGDNEIGISNGLHTRTTVCRQYADGLPTWNIFDDTNEPARTMPNALQTFNRFWQDPEQVALFSAFMQLDGVDECSSGGLIP